MPYGRRTSFRRRPAPAGSRYRRRRTTAKRTYGRKAAPTVRRTLFRPRRRPAPGRSFASIPLTVRNNVVQRRIVPITWTDSVTMYPEDDTVGSFGAFSHSWRCTSPNEINVVSSNMLGTRAYMVPSNTTGLNAMCYNAFERYTNFRVLKAQIQMYIHPTGHSTADSWDFVRPANCYLTLSESPNPWNVGTTVASIDPEESIRTGRNVVAGRTVNSAMGGSTNKPCMLTGTYTPKRIFDKPGTDPADFVGQTNGSYLTLPTHPVNQAYWNLIVLPGQAFPKSAGGATWTQGVPYPQRVDLKITYLVEFSEPETNLASLQVHDNAPVA